MRIIRFTFLCSSEEREAIRAIADKLNRSQSDALRQLIRLFQQKNEINVERTSVDD